MTVARPNWPNSSESSDSGRREAYETSDDSLRVGRSDALSDAKVAYAYACVAYLAGDPKARELVADAPQGLGGLGKSMTVVCIGTLT